MFGIDPNIAPAFIFIFQTKSPLAEVYKIRNFASAAYLPSNINEIRSRTHPPITSAVDDEQLRWSIPRGHENGVARGGYSVIKAVLRHSSPRTPFPVVVNGQRALRSTTATWTIVPDRVITAAWAFYTLQRRPYAGHQGRWERKKKVKPKVNVTLRRSAYTIAKRLN